MKLMNLDRELSNSEQKYVVEWKDKFDMKDEIIIEAVKRSVAYKGERVSLAYTNAIIESWAEKGVKSFSDILALDDAFRKKKEKSDQKSDQSDVKERKYLDIKRTDKSSAGVKVMFEKMTATAKVPTRGSAESAGYDLYADILEPLDINPHEVVKIKTGLKIAVPKGYFGAIFARSGLASKEQLAPANCVGLCDSDYRGEYVVALQNNGNVKRTVVPGERIAQLVVMPYLAVDFVEGKLDDTARGTGGFGSTGK